MQRIGLTGGIAAGNLWWRATSRSWARSSSTTTRSRGRRPARIGRAGPGGRSVRRGRARARRRARPCRAGSDRVRRSRGARRLSAIVHPSCGAWPPSGRPRRPRPRRRRRRARHPAADRDRQADLFHLVVVVHTPAELRITRLVAERGVSRAEAERRVASQASDAERLDVADVVLDGTGSIDELRARSTSCGRILPSGSPSGRRRLRLGATGVGGAPYRGACVLSPTCSGPSRPSRSSPTTRRRRPADGDRRAHRADPGR